MSDDKATTIIQSAARWLENQCKSTSPDHSGMRVVEDDLSALYCALGVLLEHLPEDSSDTIAAVREFAFWGREAIDLERCKRG